MSPQAARRTAPAAGDAPLLYAIDRNWWKCPWCGDLFPRRSMMTTTPITDHLWNDCRESPFQQAVKGGR